MVKIIAGTTPTIEYKFRTVDPEDFTAAYLTVKDAAGTEVLRKALGDATVDTESIGWKLSQTETLAFTVGEKHSMMINWVTTDGTRGASATELLICDSNHIMEVI